MNRHFYAEGMPSMYAWAQGGEPVAVREVEPPALSPFPVITHEEAVAAGRFDAEAIQYLIHQRSLGRIGILGPAPWMQALHLKVKP